MLMQLIIVRRSLALGVVFTTSIWHTASFAVAQAPAPLQQIQPTTTTTNTYFVPSGVNPQQHSVNGFQYRVDSQGRLDSEAMEEQRQVVALQEKLKSKNADAETKEAARKKMTEILAKQFDRDLESRAKQITVLESQLATLKEQIEKRRTVKDRLVELRLELVLNEAEGLGFPSSWNSSPTFTTQLWTGGSHPGSPITVPVPPVIAVPPITQ